MVCWFKRLKMINGSIYMPVDLLPSGLPKRPFMKTPPVILALTFCLGCAHTPTPFVQNDIRIVPPVIRDDKDMLISYNDGGTLQFKITDAEGKKFDVYIDHRLVSDGAGGFAQGKGSGDIYLLAYPGNTNSVRVVNQREFKKKIGDFK